MGERAVPFGPARYIQTTTADGDVGRDAPGGESVRRSLTEVEWTTLRQIHGDEVVVVTGPGGRLDREGDGIVTTATDTPIAMFGADCSLVGFTSDEGVIGVAHAGWRGLAAGILSAVVATMRQAGATEIAAVVGPMIASECYEFGAEDLDRVAAALGDDVRSSTAAGRPALDLPTGVAGALSRAGIADVSVIAGCTACQPGWYSFRARGERERHGLVLWLPAR